MQFIVEARELTSEYTHRPSFDRESRHLQVEADDHDQAISRFLAQQQAELVSVSRPGRGFESIATVKKADSVYLVRVYPESTGRQVDESTRRDEADVERAEADVERAGMPLLAAAR